MIHSAIVVFVGVVLQVAFRNVDGSVSYDKQTFVIKYKQGDQFIPVTVQIDWGRKTEYIISMHPAAKGSTVTLYDFNKRIIAYKDLTTRNCFISKMKQESLHRELRLLETLQNEIIVNVPSTTLYASNNSLSNVAVNKIAGENVRRFCNGMKTSLIALQLKDRQKRQARQYIRDSYEHQGTQYQNYSHYGHKTRTFGTSTPYRTIYGQQQDTGFRQFPGIYDSFPDKTPSFGSSLPIGPPKTNGLAIQATQSTGYSLQQPPVSTQGVIRTQYDFGSERDRFPGPSYQDSLSPSFSSVTRNGIKDSRNGFRTGTAAVSQPNGNGATSGMGQPSRQENDRKQITYGHQDSLDSTRRFQNGYYPSLTTGQSTSSRNGYPGHYGSNDFSYPQLPSTSGPSRNGLPGQYNGRTGFRTTNGFLNSADRPSTPTFPQDGFDSGTADSLHLPPGDLRTTGTLSPPTDYWPPVSARDDRHRGGIGATSDTTVKSNKKSTVANAVSSGELGPQRSQSQVQGTYDGKGSFSAQALSSFTGGSTQSQVSGGPYGGASGASANVEQLGSVQSQVQAGQPDGLANAAAQSTFRQGQTQVQAEGSRDSGSASSQAQSMGLSGSQAKVNLDGDSASAGGDFEGEVSASSRGGPNSAQSNTNLQGTYSTGRRYSATAQGTYDTGSGYSPGGSLRSDDQLGGRRATSQQPITHPSPSRSVNGQPNGLQPSLRFPSDVKDQRPGTLVPSAIEPSTRQSASLPHARDQRPRDHPPSSALTPTVVQPPLSSLPGMTPFPTQNGRNGFQPLHQTQTMDRRPSVTDMDSQTASRNGASRVSHVPPQQPSEVRTATPVGTNSQVYRPSVSSIPSLPTTLTYPSPSTRVQNGHQPVYVPQLPATLAHPSPIIRAQNGYQSGHVPKIPTTLTHPSPSTRVHNGISAAHVPKSDAQPPSRSSVYDTQYYPRIDLTTGRPAIRPYYPGSFYEEDTQMQSRNGRVDPIVSPAPVKVHGYPTTMDSTRPSCCISKKTWQSQQRGSCCFLALCCKPRYKTQFPDPPVVTEPPRQDDRKQCDVVQTVCYIVYKTIGQAKICKPELANIC